MNRPNISKSKRYAYFTGTQHARNPITEWTDTTQPDEDEVSCQRERLKQLDMEKNNRTRKKLATTRDICTSFYAKGTLGPEPLVKQRSKELKTISHPSVRKDWKGHLQSSRCNKKQ